MDSQEMDFAAETGAAAVLAADTGRGFRALARTRTRATAVKPGNI